MEANEVMKQLFMPTQDPTERKEILETLKRAMEGDREAVPTLEAFYDAYPILELMSEGVEKPPLKREEAYPSSANTPPRKG